MKQRSASAAVGVAVLIVLFSVANTSAVTVDFIEPATEGGAITVLVDGVAQVVAPNPEQLSFSFTIPGVRLPAVSLSVLGALIEPGSPPAAPIVSDAVQFSVTPSAPTALPSTDVSLIFLSEVEGQALPPTLLQGLSPNQIHVEDGTLQTIFSIGEIVTVRVQSDVERVPESSTLLLIGSGLVGIGATWRRHRRDR
jgi:hypothetical protein